MSTRMRDLLSDGFDQLRLEPIAKRIRAVQAGGSVVDSTRAVLVWSCRRAPLDVVPVEDVRGELVPESDPGTGAAGQAGGADTAGVQLPDVTSRPVLDPSIPFAVHTTAGQVVAVRAGGQDRPGAGFRPADPALAGMSSWTSADSTAGTKRTSPTWGTRVTPSTASTCWPARGPSASSWMASCSPSRPARPCCSRPCCPPGTTCPARTSGPGSSRARRCPTAPIRAGRRTGRPRWARVIPDLAWAYEEPLHDAAQVGGLIAFFDERIDVTLDGRRRERPVTPWSRGAEAGAAEGAGPPGRRPPPARRPASSLPGPGFLSCRSPPGCYKGHLAGEPGGHD